MNRFAVIIGTRPEAIKMAPVVRELELRRPGSTVVCLTGQHRDIVGDILSLFEIAADANLAIMQAGQDLAGLTARAIEAVYGFLGSARPDAVLVQGDTTSVMAASLAAFYSGLPVGHVEAGLRSFDYAAPYPEEMNRVLVGRLATWHFAPTGRARANLVREGVDERRVHVTGNTVIDALLAVRGRVRSGLPSIDGLPAGHWPVGATRRLVLVTSHRRENFGKPLEQICTALRTLAERFPAVDFVYPVHPNPVVREATDRLLAGSANIHLIQPTSYVQTVALLDACVFVMTDSGGLQEEAPALGKPVLVLREVTERPEGIEAGVSQLVGTSTASIVAAATELLECRTTYERFAHAVNPYGDGTAARQIADVLLKA